MVGMEAGRGEVVELRSPGGGERVGMGVGRGEVVELEGGAREVGEQEKDRVRLGGGGVA